MEQCREANQLIPVAEFTIKGSLFAATTAQKHVLSTEQGSGTESAAIEASHIAEHQPKLNSSHNDCPSGNEMLQTDQLSSSKRALSCPSKLAELGAAASSSNTSYLQAAGKAGSSISSLNGTSSAVVAEMASEVVIPLPTFREYVAPVVPLTVLEIAQKRRRSERISDLMEDDSDEEVLQGTDCIHYEGNGHHAKKSKMDFESWEAVRNIPIDLSIPIIYLPGEEGDKLPPFVLTKSACHSTTAKGGSGIKGLDHKGKKVPHHLSKAHKKSASGPSSKAYQPKSGSSGGVVGSKPKAKSSNEEYTPNYYNVTDSKGEVAKACYVMHIHTIYKRHMYRD